MATFYIDDIVNITAEGILCKNGIEEFEIKFSECVKNFLIDFPSSSGRCVATSDIIHGCYIFYTVPKTVIKIRGKNCVISFFKKPKLIRKFVGLQQKILRQGYTTYDLT